HRAELGAIAAQVAGRPPAIAQLRRAAAEIVVARRRGEGIVDDWVGDGVGEGHDVRSLISIRGHDFSCCRYFFPISVARSSRSTMKESCPFSLTKGTNRSVR